MSRFFYRIEDLDLMPGNKLAGFVLCVDPATLRELAHITAGEAEHRALVRKAQERAQRAGLGNKVLRSGMNIHFYNGTSVPRVFHALSGSIGADPETFPRMASPGFLDRVGPTVDYTPHNMDSPVEAMLVMLLVQTWGEWATYQLMHNEQKLKTLPPPLEVTPNYGLRMTLAEFEADEQAGALIPDDGSGYFATEDGMSRLDCFGTPPAWATHVIWFNK